MIYLGKPAEYWLELQKQADLIGVSHLISELATLRAKLSFYEARINEMNSFMQLKLEVKSNPPS